MLVDIDLKKNKAIIDRMIDYIKIAPLRVSILFKLSFYLAFKAADDKPLEAYLKNKIQSLKISLDNKVDIGELHKSFSKTTKRKLVIGKR